jgi:excisionase family DNA binding protein
VSNIQIPRLWLSAEEAAAAIGCSAQAVYRDIREGQFPFEYVRTGRKILISARSIGLIPAPGGAENSEGANAVESLPATTTFAPETT